MPSIRPRDVTIHYESFGHGPAVVLVHGFGDSSDSLWVEGGWVRDLQRAGRRAVALDLRGHGESERPTDPQAYRAEALVDDLAAVLEEATDGPVDFVGFSLGAELVIRYALQHGTARLRRAALLGLGRPLLRPRRKATALSLEALRAPDVSHLHPALQSYRRLFEGRHGDLPALIALLEAQARREPMPPEALATLDRPVLFVSGAADRTVGDAAPVARHVPGAQLLRIPGADHDDTARDPRTRERVLDFLAEETA